MGQNPRHQAKNEPGEPQLTAHERALRRLLGIAIAKGQIVFRVSTHEDLYFVSSASLPDEGWLVSYQDGHPVCECEGYRYRGYCGHLALVLYLRRELDPAPLAAVTPLSELTRRPARKVG